MKIKKPCIPPFNTFSDKELIYLAQQGLSVAEIDFTKELLGYTYDFNTLSDNFPKVEEMKKFNTTVKELAKEQELRKIPEYFNTLTDNLPKVNKNPLKLCETENKSIIEPNEINFMNGKTLKNTGIINNLFKDSLVIYECINNKRYMCLPFTEELLEFTENEQYDVISNFHKDLKDISKKIVNLRILSKLQPIKEIEANEDVISFTDGLFNLKTSKKINKITLENIPKTHLDIEFNYKPSETEKTQTITILKHIFKDPKMLIYRLKDIFFNKKILKGYTIVYGVTGSGKTVFLSRILGRLTNDKSVNASNFNRHLERESLITNGLTLSCDEIQNTMLHGSYFNQFTGGNNKVPIGRKFKSSTEINPAHVFLSGENVPIIVNDTSGSYSRAFILETQNNFKELEDNLKDFLETKEFINTLFYLIKECYKKEPRVKEQKIDANMYKDYRRDLNAVLSKYIYSNPNEIDCLTKGKNGITCKLMKYNEKMKENYSEEFLEVNTGYRLDFEAIKILISYLQENNMIDKFYSLDSSFSRKLSFKVFPTIVDDYNNSNEQVMRIRKKTSKIKLDITPNMEALDILRKKGIDITEYHFINDISEENAYLE